MPRQIIKDPYSAQKKYLKSDKGKHALRKYYLKNKEKIRKKNYFKASQWKLEKHFLKQFAV